MKVKDVMHKGVDWVDPETPVTELAKLMCEHDIGAIPIGENDRLIGMVTDRDIVCKGLAVDSFDARRATARDVMTPGIHCCRDDDDLAKAVRHMEGLKVRREIQGHGERRVRVDLAGLGGAFGGAPRAARELDGLRPRAAHLPVQPVGGGGFCVSSMAQNGIDHTKSAEVPVRVSPGMPSKIGGWPVKP